MNEDCKGASVGSTMQPPPLLPGYTGYQVPTNGVQNLLSLGYSLLTACTDLDIEVCVADERRRRRRLSR